VIAALIMRAAPAIAAVVVAGLIYAKGRDDGWTARENDSLRAQIVAERDVAKREGELQRQVDAGAAELSHITAQLGDEREANHGKRSVYYVQNPAAAAAVCLADQRMQHHRDNDAGAKASLTASGSDATVQPDPGAVPER
jgi:hypothetical protein